KIDIKNESDEIDKIELHDESIWMTTKFGDFEDVIQLSHYFQGNYEKELDTILYHFEDSYFFYVEIPTELIEAQEEIVSQILEFSDESNVTYHILDEYGKVIFDQNVFTKVKEHFPVA